MDLSSLLPDFVAVKDFQFGATDSSIDLIISGELTDGLFAPFQVT
jgi:hypothetical protein